MRRRLRSLCMLVSFLAMAMLSLAAPVHLRTDYRVNPLGTDNVAPRFSWQSDSTERNWRQSGYEILVASTQQKLHSGTADVWDSGKQNSDESVGIAYAGPALESRKRYYWSVRIWDVNGQQSQSDEDAWWEMGLLQQSDWSAKWITRTDPDADTDRAGIHWIWAAGQDAMAAIPKSIFVFRTTVKLKEKAKDAALFVIARGEFKVQINGTQVGAKREWHEFDREDVTEFLKPGRNTIEISVTVAEPNTFDPDTNLKTRKQRSRHCSK